MSNTTINRFRSVEQQQREDEKAQMIRRSRDAYFRDLIAARKHFPEPHAQMAASVIGRMRAFGEEPTVKKVRTEMVRQWPWMEEVL